MKELIDIQSKLKVPKKRYNKFGDFYYRNTDDILEAIKPLLKENNCVLTLNDEIIEIAGRFYVKATAKITNSEGASVATTALAQEGKGKGNMSESQVTGSTSSYARKYALNGLLCIDDSVDPDSIIDIDEVVKKVWQTKSLDQLESLWNEFKENDTPDHKLRKAVVEKGKEFKS